MKIFPIVTVVLFTALLFTPTAVVAQSSDRSGFTINVDLGLGIQKDTAIGESAIGLSGLNLGLGGWANDSLAIIARVAGTNASYDFGGFGDIRQVSGFIGPAVQIWPSARGYLEGGIGVGYWNAEGDSEQGLGLLLGAGVSILNKGKHNLILGVIFAPAFTDNAVYNFGINLGYQLW